MVEMYFQPVYQAAKWLAEPKAQPANWLLLSCWAKGLSRQPLLAGIRPSQASRQPNGCQFSNIQTAHIISGAI